MLLRRIIPLSGANAAIGDGMAISRKFINKFSPIAGATVTTISTTVTPTFGTGPYTHAWAWSYTSDIIIDSPASPTTTFTYTGSGYASTSEGNAIDTVTDSLGVVKTESCNVHIQVGGQIQ